MPLNVRRAPLALGGAFLVALIVSVALFLGYAQTRGNVVLFFPVYDSHSLSGESRVLPRKATIEENLTILVNAVILGPEKLDHGRDLPRSTTIRSLLYRDQVLYLDFSPEILFPEAETALGFSESLEAVKRTIIFNYPVVDKIVFTVEGEQPKSEISAILR